jgi:hypothetical protein
MVKQTMQGLVTMVVVKVVAGAVVAGMALASLQAWQASAGRPPSQLMVTDAAADNPLIDMGGTFYTVEAKAVRVRMRFARGTAIAERSADGDIRVRMTDPSGNTRNQLVVDLTGGTDSTLTLRDADGNPTTNAATRRGVRPTLDWAAMQLHALDTDPEGPLEWRGRFMRSKGAPQKRFDEEVLDVETEFENGRQSKTRRIVEPKLGVMFVTTVHDGSVEVGRMVWRPQKKTLVFDFTDLTAGTITEDTLKPYGGWPFQPTPSWANVQGFAYYDFGVRLRNTGQLVKRSRPEQPNAAAGRTAPIQGARATQRVAATRDAVSARLQPPSLLRRFEDLFVTPAYANDVGCDELHWLDGSMFRYCCDVHDYCYVKTGCTAQSWRWPWEGTSWKCVACNAAAVACFAVIQASGADDAFCHWFHWQFNVWPPGCEVFV